MVWISCFWHWLSIWTLALDRGRKLGASVSECSASGGRPESTTGTRRVYSGWQPEPRPMRHLSCLQVRQPEAATGRPAPRLPPRFDCGGATAAATFPLSGYCQPRPGRWPSPGPPAGLGQCQCPMRAAWSQAETQPRPERDPGNCQQSGHSPPGFESEPATGRRPGRSAPGIIRVGHRGAYTQLACQWAGYPPGYALWPRKVSGPCDVQCSS